MRHNVVSDGQPHRLIDALNKEGVVTHNAKATGTLSRVNVASVAAGPHGVQMPELIVAQLRFCFSSMRTAAVHKQGDGGKIPRTLPVVIVGFERIAKQNLPMRAGFHTLENVNIYPNGKCTVRCKEDTRFVFEHQPTSDELHDVVYSPDFVSDEEFVAR